jgi:serine phosphatase RsbU (regulator of sigma subunit)
MRIDVASGEGVMHIAGHPPPVLLDPRPQALGSGRPGPPLGLFDESWPGVPVSLGQRWSLMLYTDGLIEGKAGQDRRVLGPEGLLDLLAALSPSPSAPGFQDTLADSLLKTVERLNGGPMADDLAVIIVGRHP